MELIITEKKKLAIFNGLDFHNEMYGFILNYAKNTNQFVDIYTDNNDIFSWFEFYSLHFKNFSIKPTKEYPSSNNYEYVFLVTDSDWNFKTIWFEPNVVTINHHFKENRNPFSINYINVANFKNSTLDYCIPCYPVTKASNKVCNNVISIVGGYEISLYKNKYNTNLINRLTFNNNKPVELHIISKIVDKSSLDNINKNIIVYIHENITTCEMDKVLTNSSYIILTSCDSESKYEAESAAGSIQLAYNYLCRPIINKYTNKYLKLTGAFEYDENDTNNCLLEEVNFAELEKCRTTYVNYLPIALKNLQKNLLIPKKIIQTWETKDLSFEFQQIVNSWKIYNPDYEYELFDKYDREKFIKEHFTSEILIAYNKIQPGAYKADLFRYCYLYVNGGIYVDIDTLCLGKLDNFLLPNISLITPVDLNINPIDGEYNLLNCFIASRPKHKIFLQCIYRIIDNVKNKYIPVSKLDFTGPGILGRCVNLYLQNNETSSYVNKEGIIKDISLLKFERETEEVKDINNNLLFQNKNGNPMIAKIYNAECKKIPNYSCWVTSKSIIKDEITDIKTIALMIYGQFRSYTNNLRQNILALWPIFENKIVHVFILTDRKSEGNYSIKNENEILDIFKEFKFNVRFINYIENIDCSDEKSYCDIYNKTVKHRIGIANDFVPNLMYRKYLLNKLTNQFINSNQLNIDVFMYARLFDMCIYRGSNVNTIHVDFEKIQSNIYLLLEDKNNILGSSDTFFMGSKRSIEYLFNNWKNNGDIKLFHNEDLWSDTNFSKFLYSTDSVLTMLKHTYAPEIQYISRLYYSEFKYHNIRFDHNNPLNISETMMYTIIHDPARFNVQPSGLYIDFSNEIILKANQCLNNPDIHINYSTELTKMLILLSYQLSNANITTINSFNSFEPVMLAYFHRSNNKRLAIYSFNNKSDATNNNHSILLNYPIKNCSENIFINEVREKYRTLLLTSKVIYINIFAENINSVLELFKWLLQNKFDGLIIYRNLSGQNVFDDSINKYMIKISTFVDPNIGFIKFI